VLVRGEPTWHCTSLSNKHGIVDLVQDLDSGRNLHHSLSKVGRQKTERMIIVWSVC
jgi:hypothetical protein